MKAMLVPTPTATAQKTPRKLFYKIQEVARMTGLKPYVLRYWETEFKELAPAKDASDQRRYRAADVEVVRAIRKLLYEDRFTIEGARKRIKDELRDMRARSNEAVAGSAPVAAAGSARRAKGDDGHPELPFPADQPAPDRKTARRLDRALKSMRKEVSDLLLLLS